MRNNIVKITLDIGPDPLDPKRAVVWTWTVYYGLPDGGVCPEVWDNGGEELRAVLDTPSLWWKVARRLVKLPTSRGVRLLRGWGNGPDRYRRYREVLWTHRVKPIGYSRGLGHAPDGVCITWEGDDLTRYARGIGR